MPYFDPDTYTDPTATSEDYLGVAADMVARYAPAPDPEPSDYAAKAARAERLIFNYLMSTSGAILSGASLSSTGSVSFSESSLKNIRAIVRTAMGEYYSGGTSGGAYTITASSSFPEATEGA